jgi:Bacteriophage related domain of unknown function
MSYAAIQSAIYARFGSAYVAGTPPTGGWNLTLYPVVAENQPWAGTAAKQPTDKAWGRLSVRFADSRDTTVDAKARRVAGIVWLQIFVPEEKGSIVAQQMSDEMERIFGRKTVTTAAAPPTYPSGETIRFERAVPGYVGKESDGWQQFRCTISFISDAVTP